MNSNYIQLALYLAVAIILVRTDAIESSDDRVGKDERVGKIEQIKTAFQTAGSRRLMPAIDLDSIQTELYPSQTELDSLTDTYGLVWRDNQIAVRVIFSGDEPDGDTTLREALENIDGFDVEFCTLYMCGGWCDINALDSVESLSEVSQISPSSPQETSDFSGSGSVRTHAIAATQIKQVLRKNPELTGAGVKIGIISDSFDRNPTLSTTEQDDINSGDLPGGSNRVKIINDSTNIVPDSALKDEGRAMAQLIYDLVPEAQMVFHTGFLTGGNFALAIEALVEEGCDIIVDDVRSDEEPFFQLGLSAKAANKAAEENGIAYFTSARNYRSSSWENRGFKDAPCPPQFPFLANYSSCHEFGGDLGVYQFIPLFSFNKFVFQWDDPWQSINGPPGPQTDLDVFLFNATNGELLNFGVESNVNGDAIESFYPLPGFYFFLIAKRSGPSPNVIKWLSRGLESDPTGLGNSGTVTETGNAPGTAAVGAASEKQVFGELVMQDYSSLGGVPLIFDDDGNRRMEELVLNQPRFVGPDGSYTTFFGVGGLEDAISDGNPPPRFFGTSCSAPNIAAVAAILIQATSVFNTQGRRLRNSKSGKQPKSAKSSKNRKSSKSEETKDDFLFPYDIYKIMEETAIDMNQPGYDFFSGHGFVNALAAVEAIKKAFEENEVADSESCPVENFLYPIDSYYDEPQQ